MGDHTSQIRATLCDGSRTRVKRQDNDGGFLVVTGEVVVPAPDFRPGQVVTDADLDIVVHYDGAFMTREDVRLLAHRYLNKRPSFDVGHDRKPRGVQATESFVASDDSTEYVPGSFVLGAMVIEEAVALGVEGGDYTAWSVDFNVDITPVVVMYDTGSGLVPIQLLRFSNPDPHYVSFTGNPATGVHWASAGVAQRAVADDAPWDQQAATERLLKWAVVESDIGPALSLQRCSQVFACMRERGFALPYADVLQAGGEPVTMGAALREIAGVIDGGSDIVRQITRHDASLKEITMPNAIQHIKAEAAAVEAKRTAREGEAKPGGFFSSFRAVLGLAPAALEEETAPEQGEATRSLEDYMKGLGKNTLLSWIGSGNDALYWAVWDLVYEWKDPEDGMTLIQALEQLVDDHAAMSKAMIAKYDGSQDDALAILREGLESQKDLVAPREGGVLEYGQVLRAVAAQRALEAATPAVEEETPAETPGEPAEAKREEDTPAEPAVDPAPPSDAEVLAAIVREAMAPLQEEVQAAAQRSTAIGTKLDAAVTRMGELDAANAELRTKIEAAEVASAALRAENAALKDTAPAAQGGGEPSVVREKPSDSFKGLLGS